MARRSFDGKKIFNESWDNNTRLALFWLIGNADQFGMQKESVGGLSDVLRVSKKVAADCIEKLIEDEVILPYGEDGFRFFIFRKWQDYQSFKYGGKPSCPPPPDGIFYKLSINTQDFLRDKFPNILQVVSIKQPADSRQQTAKEEFPEGGGAGEAQPLCPFCKPLGEKPTDIQKLVKFCHDAYIAARGKHPTFKTGTWIGVLDPLMKQHNKADGKEEEKVRVQKVYEHYLKSQDSWIQGKSFGITLFTSNFDSVSDALDRKEIHGITSNRKAGQPIRRHDAAPPEAFGKSGKISL